MQQLAEDNITLKPPKKHRNKKKTKKSQNNNIPEVPYITGQQQLLLTKTEKQTTLLTYT